MKQYEKKVQRDFTIKLEIIVNVNTKPNTLPTEKHKERTCIQFNNKLTTCQAEVKAKSQNKSHKQNNQYLRLKQNIKNNNNNKIKISEVI